MVAFGFCPKTFGGVGNLRMMVLVKNKCNLNSGDSHKLVVPETPGICIIGCQWEPLAGTTS